MDYSEIQIKILLITNELNSVVSVSSYDYTHHPDNEYIRSSIDDCIRQLEKIKSEINN